MKQEEVSEIISKYADAKKIRILMEYGEKTVIPLNNVVNMAVDNNLLRVVYNSSESEDGLALTQHKCKDIEVIQVQY